jgi:hypothetical protein
MKRGSLTLLVLLVGCEPHFESGKTLCSDLGECPGGFFCSNGVCVDNQLGPGSGGNGGNGANGGNGGNGGSAGSPSTEGDACNSLGASFCPPLMACYPASYSAVSQCVQDFVNGCCGISGTCSLSVNVDAYAFQQCNTALAQLDCTGIMSVYMTQTPPSACTSYASYNPY